MCLSDKNSHWKRRWNRKVYHLVICIVFWNRNALYHFLPFHSGAISMFMLLNERVVVSIHPLIFSSRDRRSDTGHSNFSFRRAHLKWPRTTVCVCVCVFMQSVFHVFGGNVRASKMTLVEWSTASFSLFLPAWDVRILFYLSEKVSALHFKKVIHYLSRISLKRITRRSLVSLRLFYFKEVVQSQYSRRWCSILSYQCISCCLWCNYTVLLAHRRPIRCFGRFVWYKMYR